METKFQTSFIPKQPVTEAAKHHTSAASLFFLVAFIMFMASLAAAAGVFLYSRVVDTNIAEGNKQLALNRNAFDPNTIQQYTRLNDRINAVYSLLKLHRSPSTLFQVLSNVTLKTVQFTDFQYTDTGDKINLSMKGQAYNYETVALQAQAFTDPALRNVFKSPIFGDLNLDNLGNVSFSFTTQVDPFLVNYYQLMQEESGTDASSTVDSSPSAIVNNSETVNGNQAAGSQGFIETSSTGAGASGAGNVPVQGNIQGADQGNGQGGTQDAAQGSSQPGPNGVPAAGTANPGGNPNGGTSTTTQ